MLDYQAEKRNKPTDMNSKQKYQEQMLNHKDWNENMTEILPSKGILKVYDQNSKPAQYQIGIDTFARMEANCSKEEILAFCKGNIDKYTWRTKGCDLEDFKKIIDYANFAIKQLEKNG